MIRADIPNLDDRKPFYLYVDEFQNFATESFGAILSEARKYSLFLTVANQYVGQMEETVRDAIFGNVGSMISFRVGPGDSVVLGKYFEPEFEPADLTRLNNQHMFVSMIIDGEKSLPFSATTLRVPAAEADLTDQIISVSRQRYASSREAVEIDINARTTSGQQQSSERPAPGQPGGGRPALSSSLSDAQIPNRPRSEFLGALQNPELPPVPAGGEQRGRGSYSDNRPPRRDNYRDGGGSGNGGNGGGNRYPRQGQSQGGGGQHNNQQSSPQRDDAVRQAIRAAQANQRPENPQR
jgi:hypothetical protein